MSGGLDSPSFAHIVENMNVGVVVVDSDDRVVYWNRFMAAHVRRSAEEVVGRPLFDTFPELPRQWLTHKLRTVRILGTPAFSSWHQRPYLFAMAHNRTVTGSVDYMRQDCSFLPLEGEAGDAGYVGIIILDVTETAVSQAALDEANQRLEEASIRDPLTGLHNRRHAEATLNREVERARRSGQSLAVLLFDVDHFKMVNDTHGHPAGDAVLKALAEALREEVREADMVARFGGEEFLLIMPDTDEEAAIGAVHRLRERILALRAEAEGVVIPFTVSGGLVALTDDVSTPDELVRAADQYLYIAKSSGRDRIIRASDSVVIAGGEDRSEEARTHE
ncbi:MAG: diguanylate cyclase [Pseudomonadota bacterium]